MKALDSSGGRVVLDTVVIRSPGLAGDVQVLDPVRPGDSRSRGWSDDLPGAVLAALEAGELDEQLTIEISSHALTGDARDTGPAGRAAQGTGELEVEVPGPGDGYAQVLLAQAENGALSWHLPHVDDLGAVGRGGTATHRYRLPVRIDDVEGPRFEEVRRGLATSLGKKVLRVLLFRIAKHLAGGASRAFAERWENTHRPSRLRALTPTTGLGPEDPGAAGLDFSLLATDRPALLFLHGTASTSYSAFGRLPADVMAQLYQRYEGRVVAYEHPTLSRDPADNARALATQLEQGLGRRAGVRLDIVAHSRGGLVARELCEQQAPLGVAEGLLRVRSVALVGVPNSGTVLADPDRLESLLSRLTTLMALIPDNPVTDTLDCLITAVKVLAVGAMEGLPGLTAMSPTSDYLSRLNIPSMHETAYWAAGSNYEPPPGSILATCRDGLTDLVFGKVGNDLVVPTEGTFTAAGASGFPVPKPLCLSSKETVDHSGYWSHEPFTRGLLDWLAVTR